eukprot:scaffold22787_cov78-Skeletonema_dohrnii-CCMP3373.AAC.2
MMAADGWYTFTGGEAIIPLGVTRVRIHESLTVIPAHAFQYCHSIEEVDCHVGVKTVEKYAFYNCISLRRVIMPGVEVVEGFAFNNCCEALEDVECGRLETIERYAFSSCESLGSINLPSAKIVEMYAFYYCTALTEIKFGKALESIRVGAFDACTSLQQITIPLKDVMITDDDTFQGCENLKHVDLVEGEVHETIAYLQLEEWKNDMNEEINSINQILSNTPAGDANDDDDDVGGKARAIRMWIRSVLGKIIHYKAQHQHALEEAAATLQLQVALPQDIVMKNVIPFLELPSYTFEVGDHEDEEDDSDNEDDVDDFDDDESSY